mmetsp:Transcript_9189/g.24109  ORF Transcript_9189/g.24109 Transcript_9189/m.24109 type:complete len:273 (-) Transcript_9189:1705-2523(-)
MNEWSESCTHHARRSSCSHRHPRDSCHTAASSIPATPVRSMCVSSWHSRAIWITLSVVAPLTHPASDSVLSLGQFCATETTPCSLTRSTLSMRREVSLSQSRSTSVRPSSVTLLQKLMSTTSRSLQPRASACIVKSVTLVHHARLMLRRSGQQAVTSSRPTSVTWGPTSTLQLSEREWRRGHCSAMTASVSSVTVDTPPKSISSTLPSLSAPSPAMSVCPSAHLVPDRRNTPHRLPYWSPLTVFQGRVTEAARRNEWQTVDRMQRWGTASRF